MLVDAMPPLRAGARCRFKRAADADASCCFIVFQRIRHTLRYAAYAAYGALLAPSDSAIACRYIDAITYCYAAFSRLRAMPFFMLPLDNGTAAACRYC